MVDINGVLFSYGAMSLSISDRPRNVMLKPPIHSLPFPSLLALPLWPRHA